MLDASEQELVASSLMVSGLTTIILVFIWIFLLKSEEIGAQVLQNLLPKLMQLLPDFPDLNIDYDSRRDGVNNINTSVLVRVSHPWQRDANMKGAMSKIPIICEGSTVRFYHDIPAAVFRRLCEFDRQRHHDYFEYVLEALPSQTD